jgi:hypothetical protein
VRRDIIEQANFQVDELVALCLEVMGQIVVGPKIIRDIDDFLLSEHHPSIVESIRETAAKFDVTEARRIAGLMHVSGPGAASSGSSSPSKRQRSEKWPEKHACLFESLGMDWSAPTFPNVETLEQFPGLKGLRERNFELLSMNKFTFPDKKRTINLSQAHDRARSRDGAQIVTPRTLLYLGHRCRTLHVLEGMALQGLHFGPRHRLLQTFPNKLLLDLSGNAFMANCCGSVALLAEVVMAHCRRRTHLANHSSIPRALAFEHDELLCFQDGQDTICESTFELTFTS